MFEKGYLSTAYSTLYSKYWLFFFISSTCNIMQLYIFQSEPCYFCILFKFIQCFISLSY